MVYVCAYLCVCMVCVCAYLCVYMVYRVYIPGCAHSCVNMGRRAEIHNDFFSLIASLDFFFFFNLPCFETGPCYVALTGLELAMLTKLASNSGRSIYL